VAKIVHKTQKSKTIVVAFGRFNPPTSGHQLLFNKVVDTAAKMGADHAIGISQTQEPKKNPLSPSRKLYWLNQLFPSVNFVSNTKIQTPFDLMYALSKKGYTHIIIVSGEDRAEGYDMIRKYIGHKDPDKRLDIKRLDVVSLKRDAKSRGVSGMSASKMREAVAKGNLKAFTSGLPTTGRETAKRLFDEIKKGMKGSKPDVVAQIKKAVHTNKRVVFNAKTKAPAKQSASSQADHHSVAHHKAGDVWKTSSGLWGAKDSAGKFEYFDDMDVQSAYKFAKRRNTGIRMKEEYDFTDLFHSAAKRMMESDKKKRRPPTPGQTGGFSKHNKKYPTPPCNIDEDAHDQIDEDAGCPTNSRGAENTWVSVSRGRVQFYVGKASQPCQTFGDGTILSAIRYGEEVYCALKNGRTAIYVIKNGRMIYGPVRIV
jgi:hypothetical protein